MSSRTLAHSLTSGKRAQAVESFRQRVVWLVFGRLFFAWAAGWLLLWGMVVLVLRVAWHDVSWAQLAWGALGLVPAIAGAAVMAARSAPDSGQVLALLDARSDAHGLMLLEEEHGDLGPWGIRVPTAPELRLSWQAGKGLWAAFFSLLFVAAAFAVPVPAAVLPGPKLDVAGPAAQLKLQAATLKELGLLEEPKAEEIKQRINQVEGSAQGESPAKTWEALDHLAAQMQATADQAKEEAAKDAKATDAALNLAGALDAHADELSKDQMDAARSAQAALEDKAFEQATDGGLPGVKPPPGLQIPSALMPKMPAGQRQAMRDFLRKNRQQLNELNRRLAQAKMGNGGQPPRPLNAGEMKQLMDKMKGGQCQGGNGPLGDLLAAMDDDGEGNGVPGGKGGGKGPSKGLTWKDPSTLEGANFDPKALDRSAPDLRNSVKLGESLTAPELDAKAQVSSGGGLNSQADGGGSAARQNVLPKHRAAVDKYFERK